LSDPYGKNVNTELRTVNGSGLKLNPERHAVEERPASERL